MAKENKQMKVFNAAETSYESRLETIEQILVNMKFRGDGSGHANILLHGDPGTGKTSLARFLAHLTGLDLLVIEAPHIKEEHIINIPFIVFRDINDSGKKGTQHLENTDFKVVLSDSNLYASLSRTSKITDSALLERIYKSTNDVKKTWEAMGGSESVIPPAIFAVRKSTRTILFLDEFFRQTNPRIRNMLRGILNGRIGLHEIPDGVYTLYASNMRDDGIEDVQLNMDFQPLEIETPNKQDWFSWFVNKFEKSEHIELNHDIINKFWNLLEEEDLNVNDISSEIRVSPRRWEQLLLYINSSLPVKDEREAKSLLSNVKASFKNYQTGDLTGISKKVLNAVSELIEETSNIKSTSTNSDAEWRHTVQHQIQQKMKLGKARTYIPIISGPPGIGKTSEALKMASELNLRYIYIDCSTLDPEQVTGIPLSNTDKSSGSISVEFSEPQLYKQIMSDVERADRKFLQNASAEDKKKYNSKKWKYLIFFDELNRTSTKVFNSIRRVLLEKEFNHQYALPEESIVIAAINPTDIGAGDLTSHLKDVVDVIDAKPSWKNTVHYLENVKFDADDSAKNVALSTITKFVGNFKDNSAGRNNDERAFHLLIGENPVYVSPREFTDMYINMAGNLDIKIAQVQPLIATNEPKNMKTAEGILIKSVFNSFKRGLSMPLMKQHVSSPEWWSTFEKWVEKNVDFEGIFHKKVETQSLENILNKSWNDDNYHQAENVELVNYLQSHDVQQFTEDFIQFLSQHLGDSNETFKKKLMDKNDKVKIKNKDGSVGWVKTDAPVSHLMNFLRDLIIAVDTNKLDNSLKDSIRMAIRSALSTIVLKHDSDTDENEAIMEVNQKIMRFIKGVDDFNPKK